MKVLVCIASHGSRNDEYLHRLLDQYGNMPYEVKVVVLSNIEKPLPADVGLRVGAPTRNPWSLPFAHRQVFLDQKDEHDLFIYSEDDTLITQAHVVAFLETTLTLRDDEIAGFIRSEEGPDGALYYSTIHRHYHWDPRSVVVRAGATYAHLTNEHGACYMLTRGQLHRVIASGGFSTAPHEGKYDMLVSAATDPYTQCGLRKLLCISDLAKFTCRHLTNKYVGKTGVEKRIVDLQIAALLDIAKGTLRATEPIPVDTKLPGSRWAKSYYEPCDDVLVSMVPPGARRVLSVGCGWGKTEEALMERGAEVTAVALDVVIGTVARSRGVNVAAVARPDDALPLDEPGAYDAILVSRMLHLLPDPVGTLRRLRSLLAPGGVIVASYPNLAHLAVRIKRVVGHPDVGGVGDYPRSGVHLTTPARVRRWLNAAGFAMRHVEARFSGRWHRYNKVTLGLARSMWAEEFAVVADRARLAGLAGADA
jgi:2-polyprenyl-3-methyl-5-hydroxy-6-metoxy-1,4-benzoquinol methylase